MKALDIESQKGIEKNVHEKIQYFIDKIMRARGVTDEERFENLLNEIYDFKRSIFEDSSPLNDLESEIEKIKAGKFSINVEEKPP